jgi:hypothetical protein
MDKVNYKANKSCQHLCSYEIINMENSNYFIEKCQKYLMTTKTL